jgi:hypothetical protein
VTHPLPKVLPLGAGMAELRLKVARTYSEVLLGVRADAYDVIVSANTGGRAWTEGR